MLPAQGWELAVGGEGGGGILPDAKEEVSANTSSQVVSGQRDVTGRAMPH